jgi:aminotransferase
MDEIPFSEIRSIFEQVNRLEQMGETVIHLEVGRPDFDTPEHIKAACTQALNRGEVHYTSNFGILPLRQAIAKKLKRDNQLDFDPLTEILVTSGVSEGIMLCMMALLNPGDEVLIPEPALPIYAMATRMAGAVPVMVPTQAENDYQLTCSNLETHVSPLTRMLVLTTPGNPSGTVLSQCVAHTVAEFVINHNLLLLADEIYEKLIYDECEHISMASLPGMRNRTLTLNGFSKCYAMTGWRLGYVAATAQLLGALVRIHQYSIVCANSFSQWGGVVALNESQECVANMAQEFDRRRRLVMAQLDHIPELSYARPKGALYVYINVSAISDDAFNLAAKLLDKERVAVVPWDKQHIRISYSNNFQYLEIAMARFKHYFKHHL